jgi:hypothetical protein
MTPTERQQRWRANQRKQRVKIIKKATNLIAADARRKRSRAAKPLLGGFNLREGEPREVLADIEPNSTPLILTTAPPEVAEREWLAAWAAQALIPGGSLVCFTEGGRLNEDIALFARRLRYWWLLIQLRRSGVNADRGVLILQRPVLWFVKGSRRGRQTVLFDVLASPKPSGKKPPAWAQGDGIGFVIEHLTEPGEIVIDPFGDREWGRIVHRMGRRWIGADIALGGTETVTPQ